MVRPIQARQVYATYGRWFVLERPDRAAHNWRPTELSGAVLTPKVLESVRRQLGVPDVLDVLVAAYRGPCWPAFARPRARVLRSEQEFGDLALYRRGRTGRSCCAF